MRLNVALATALLLGSVRAEDVEEAESSSTTVAESSTTSVIEKPTFTVSIYANGKTTAPCCSEQALTPAFSHPTSKQTSWSNSRMTGAPDGHLLTLRKRTRRLMKNGRTLANGPSRSLISSRVLKGTRVLLSRTRQPIMPFQPSFQRRSTTGERLWSFNTKSSFKVRSQLANSKS